MGGKRKRPDGNDEEAISKKVFYVRKIMARALKKCRTFEIQKITKRLKKARTEEKTEVANTLLEELDCCKSLDVEAIADAHIKSVLIIKDPVLRKNDILMAKIEEMPLLAELKPMESRISSRLFNTTVLKTASATAKELLELAIAIDEVEPDVKDRPKHTTSEKSRSKHDKVTKPNTNTEPKKPSEDPDFDHPSPQPSHPPSAKNESAIPASNQVAPTTTSSFLPTLASQYISGSESDSAEENPRKNRRGQRARRAIWEMKFGKGANHVRGAIHPDRANFINNPESRPIQVQPVRSAVPRSAPTKPDKPVHPSWQAQQQRKNRENNVEFKGKKTTF